MKIMLGDSQSIFAFVKVGGIEGNFIEITPSAVPQEFELNFEPGLYKWNGVEIVMNESYEEPIQVVQQQRIESITMSDVVDVVCHKLDMTLDEFKDMATELRK